MSHSHFSTSLQESFRFERATSHPEHRNEMGFVPRSQRGRRVRRRTSDGVKAPPSGLTPVPPVVVPEKVV
jgi:hypothetical protein